MKGLFQEPMSALEPMKQMLNYYFFKYKYPVMQWSH